MNITKKELNKNQLELTVRVDKAEAQPYLTQAAQRLSQTRNFPGFRPGKAPYEMIKKEFGEPSIIQEATEDIVNATLGDVLEKENIRTYGKIDFDIKPVISADEVLVYSATVTIMPSVTLGKWQDNKLKRNTVSVSDEEMTKAMDELSGMATTDEPAERAAAKDDKAVVDFEVSVDGKVIEGGTAQDFALIIGEGRMIPGFEEKLIGAKANDKLEFQLSFPENYQAKHLSGKPAEFKVTVKQVLARVKPEINDGFAKRVGMENVEKLKERIKENIKKEKEDREEERVEIGAIKQVVDSATINNLPEIMITDTVHDLTHEFEHNLAHQGVKLDQYLQSVNKTMDQVKKDLEPKATERVKSSLVLGQLAEDEKLGINAEEIEEELKAQEQANANNPEAMHDIKQPEYRRHVANSLINRKIIKFIKDKIVE